MAKGHGLDLKTVSLLWILIVILAESSCSSSHTYYMAGQDCDSTILLGGAVVYSHYINQSKSYNNEVNCQIKFKSKKSDWKIMLRMLEMDIPDRQKNGICNDALYVSDSDKMYHTMIEAGGNFGLCGNQLPSTIYSSGQYLTVHFRTDKYKPPTRFDDGGRNGRGFKFIITSYSEDYDKVQSCGSAFQCDNHKCIEKDLTCDRVDHCGDYSDEAAEGPAECGVSHETILTKFLSLGVAASVGIIVGGLIVCIFCTISLVCCCRQSVCKKAPSSSSSGIMTGTTSVMTNGGPGSHHGSVHGSHHGSHHGSTHHAANHHGNGHMTQIDRGPPQHQMNPFGNPTHQGYYPMHPVYPSPHGSVYSAHTQNSAFTRDSGYNHNQFGYSSSVYSNSQAPSYHRSHTPTSSKSGKSHHSNNSVTYAHNTDKVMLPVNL
ncbi:uncharacterized protein LOC132713982 [Ruditapes philippinarum]|uniref:uncharacterized protein LOC132713982 n=1 Tax=Ruditapes philippinarum TaxID=129788 RepID=UPI00295ACD75|nr:uncharacterized protein LOC132713982 [Ruditapes philippinarum]